MYGYPQLSVATNNLPEAAKTLIATSRLSPVSKDLAGHVPGCSPPARLPVRTRRVAHRLALQVAVCMLSHSDVRTSRLRLLDVQGPV